MRLSPPRARGLLALVILALVASADVSAVFDAPLERFDEGIYLDSVSFLSHGLFVPGSAYQPYGPGYGLFAVPLQWLLGPQLLAERMAVALAPAVGTVLAFWWLSRRAGLTVAFMVSLVLGLQAIERYALPWIAVFAFLLLLDRVLRPFGGELRAAVVARPWALAGAGAVLALAALFRLEYGLFTLIWAIVVVVHTGRRTPARVVLVPLAVALAPLAVVLAAGGAQHVWWWLDYALFGFRRYRSQPVDWGLPWHWAAAAFSGGQRAAELRREMVGYVGSAVLLAVVAAGLLGRRLGILRDRDRSGATAFLVVVGAIVLSAQSVRFFGSQGLAALPLAAAAFFGAPFRSRWPAAVAAVVLVLLALPLLARRYDAVSHVRDARAAFAAAGRHEPVARLKRAPLNAEEQQDLPLVQALWRRWSRGRPLMVLNRTNDDAQANEAVLYWLLDAPPAAWPTTFDPGLADRADVQGEAGRSLCTRHAVVIQATGTYGAPFAARHGSRLLDQLVALSYRPVAGTSLYRVLVPDGAGCTWPGDAPLSQLRSKRDAALVAGETYAAGALASAVVERRSAHPDPSDVALMLMARYHVPDAQLAPGAAGAGERAIRDGRPTAPEVVALAADRSQPALVRLLAASAYAAAAGPPPGAATVLAAAWRLLRERPALPQLGDIIRAYAPPADAAFARARRYGVRARWLADWSFDARTLQDPRAIREGQALLPRLGGDPERRAAVLGRLAQAYAATGAAACRNAALAALDAIPGSDPGPYESTRAACSGLQG